jgi:hypothetical protein
MIDTPDAPPPWLPLLRRLTDASPRWAVWKNVEFALSGIGDIDSVAPVRDWPVILTEFRRWAAEHELGPVTACYHIPIGVEIIAIPDGRTTFVELGAKARRIFRGSTLYTASDFLPLMELDSRGFRRVRPGAEGLLKLVLGGLRRDGRPNWPAIREKKVLELLREDPEGVRQAARLFGFARGAALRGSDAAARGGWDRQAMLAVQTRSLLLAPLQPTVAARRTYYQFAVKGRCPVLQVLFRSHRRIPEDREAWLHAVAKDHVVFGRTPAQGPA